MPPLSPIVPAAEVGDLADEVRRLFADLDRTLWRERPGARGEYAPAIDVVETDEVIQICVDLPGMETRAIRLLLKSGIVIIAGDKAPPADDRRASASFHRVERGFGRFARAVRLSGAFDGARVRATLKAGELRIVVPKIDDRRGGGMPIGIEE